MEATIDSEKWSKRDMEYLTCGSMLTCGPKPSGSHQNQAEGLKLTF